MRKREGEREGRVRKISFEFEWIMWVQVSFVFIQSTFVRLYRENRARTHIRVRTWDRVTTRTRALLRVRPCKILSSFSPHRLHLVYSHVEREETNVGIFLSLPFLSPSSLSLSEHIHARVFVGERHKSTSTQLYQRPQKEIISDRFYRDGFSALHASCIKAAIQVSLYDPLSSSILMSLVVAVSN